MSAYLGFEPTKDPNYYFVSYNNEDADRVGPIAGAMSDSGVNLWYDHGIEYGDDWETAITEKIQHAQAVILFFSRGILPKSNSYVQREYRMATQFFNRKVYVVLLDDIKKEEVPVDKVAWWIEINETQCISGFEYESVPLLARDITASLAVHNQGDSTEAKAGLTASLHGSQAKKERVTLRRRPAFRIAVLVVTLLLALAVALFTMGAFLIAQGIGNIDLGDMTLAEYLQDEGHHVLVQMLGNLLDTLQSDSNDTTPEQTDDTNEPEPDPDQTEQDTSGNHIILIPSVPGGEDTTQTDSAQTYTVTVYNNVQYGESDGASEPERYKALEGESVTLIAAQYKGYNFEGWYYAWSDTCISRESTYIFTVKDSDAELEARYTYYTVSTSSNYDSHICAYTKLDAQKISVGEQVTLTATPGKGYNFEGWYTGVWGDTCVSKEPSYTFTMEASDVHLEARFSAYTISTSGYTFEGMAGTYTEYSREKISVGQTVTLTATVQNGYNFTGWYKGGVLISSDPVYTFTMTASDVSFEALFSCYKLSVSGNTYEGTAGAFSEYNEKIVAIGEQITLEATANDGFNFEGWYIRDVLVSSDPTYTYTMKNQDVWIEARFNYYTVTTTGYNYEGMAGSYTYYQEQKVSVGKEVSVTATVNDGYAFEGWFVNGICVSENLTHSFTMKAQNIYLEARYRED